MGSPPGKGQHRRMDEGRPGDRGGWPHPLVPRDRGAVTACQRTGRPALRSDNVPKFVSRALLQWITDRGIATAFIDPGKPWQNGTGESFNGKFRDECLSLEWSGAGPRPRR